MFSHLQREQGEQCPRAFFSKSLPKVYYPSRDVSESGLVPMRLCASTSVLSALNPLMSGIPSSLTKIRPESAMHVAKNTKKSKA